MDKFIAKKCLIEDWGVSNGIEGSDKINFTKNPKLIRKYDENYLICGLFFWTGNEEEPIPLGVVCCEKLSNGSMVPSKLKQYLSTNHGYLESKDHNYFKRLMTV